MIHEPAKRFEFSGRRREAELVLKAIGRLDTDEAEGLSDLRNRTKAYIEDLDLDKAAFELAQKVHDLIDSSGRSFWGRALKLKQVLAAVKKATGNTNDSWVAAATMAHGITNSGGKLSVYCCALVFQDLRRDVVTLGIKKVFSDSSTPLEKTAFWPEITFPLPSKSPPQNLMKWAEQENEDRIKFTPEVARRMIQLYEHHFGVELDQLVDQQREPAHQELEDGSELNPGFTVSWSKEP